jgi:hypothetical protein
MVFVLLVLLLVLFLLEKDKLYLLEVLNRQELQLRNRLEDSLLLILLILLMRLMQFEQLEQRKS